MNYSFLVFFLFLCLTTPILSFYQRNVRKSYHLHCNYVMKVENSIQYSYQKYMKVLGISFLSAYMFISFNPVVKISTHDGDNNDNNNMMMIPSVSADSTGKFSTKLTARRRYRPRILDAIPVFQDMSSGKISLDASKAYLSSEKYEDLVRAMKLYGVSLRKGELLDDISRTIDKITTTFEKDCQTFTKSKLTMDQLKLCVNDFNDYVKFTQVKE